MIKVSLQRPDDKNYYEHKNSNDFLVNKDQTKMYFMEKSCVQKWAM